MQKTPDEIHLNTAENGVGATFNGHSHDIIE